MAPRKFEFEIGVSRLEAMRAVVAALDDEGLKIAVGDNGRMNDINTVIVGGRKVMVVPGHRVVAK